MRSTYTGHIKSEEWRWVMTVSVFLVLLAFSPYLWLSLNQSGSGDAAFMGALHDYVNTAGNLAQLAQGQRGIWLTQFLYTPETHGAALIDPVYALLGQLSRLTSLSGIVVFHVARIGASLFMYLSLYQLAGNIWTKVRSRRAFFLIASLGSGFGWFFSLLFQTDAFIDLRMPGLFPFYSSLANVHLPLTFGSLALLASVIIMVVRPTETPFPNVANGGALVFAVSLILVFLYPLAYIPLVVAFIINTLLYWVAERRVISAQVSWLLWFIVPALPMLVYYIIVFQNNVVIAEIWQQFVAVRPPNPLILVLSLGLPLFIALPGLLRAFRRFERDGDQLMLMWIVVILLGTYLPTVAQASFLVGLVIPLTYFATRAIDDVWFSHLIPRRWWVRVLVVMIPLLFVSNLMVLLMPVVLIRQEGDSKSGILLSPDYVEAFNWLSSRVDSSTVILASPRASLWIPARTGAHVVYGHPALTLFPRACEIAVVTWYASADAEDCPDIILANDAYRVSYVIYGDLEQEIGVAACRESLMSLEQFGSVRVYRTTAGQARSE